MEKKGQNCMGIVLVVDEQEAVRHLARTMVEFCGYSAAEAASGAEAVELLRVWQAEIACVLLDMTMPSLSGWETFHALRGLRADLPVLVMTAGSEEQLRAFVQEHPHVALVEKPFGLQDLHRSLTLVCGESGKRAVG